MKLAVRPARPDEWEFLWGCWFPDENRIFYKGKLFNDPMEITSHIEAVIVGGGEGYSLVIEADDSGDRVGAAWVIPGGDTWPERLEVIGLHPNYRMLQASLLLDAVMDYVTDLDRVQA